jgi:hypothetical protein
MIEEILEAESLYDLTNKNSHRSLNLAIILQALLDLSRPKAYNESIETSLYRDQAMAWVFKSIGTTCEAFEETCDRAGVNPNTIRTFALKVTLSENRDEIRRKLHSFL